MASARPGADYNLRILRSLAIYIEEHKGAEKLAQFCRAGGVIPEYIDGRSFWVSSSQFESILIATRALVATDDEFKQACCYKMAESYGAMRFVLRAASPGLVFKQSLSTYHLVSRVGKHEVLKSSRTSMEARFTADTPPHRLVCLCKGAQVVAMPTLWGLPPANLEEEGCVGLGDRACVWRLRWFDEARWGPTLLGAALGALSGYALHKTGVSLDPAAIPIMTLLAGCAAHIRELYATGKANRRVEQEMTRALESLVAAEIQSRQELLELHGSQREWSRLLEEEARDRGAAIQKLTTHFEQVEQSRTQLFRGYSHDLRNPLQVMRLGTGYLRHALESDDKAKQVIDELDWSVSQMNQLLTDLNRIAAQPTGAGQLTPQELATTDLTERIRRRVRALAHGRDIRTTVFATREAPPSIHIDPVLFDRVVDNLLTNAVKYTERGSIIVELDGEVGCLVLKISDTGRGIAQEDLDKTFTPGGSDEKGRAANSLGVGLSVVVQLLGQISGRLEVMSKPDVGTTFWIKLPVKLTPQPESAHTSTESYRNVFQRVVSIRRTAN